MRTVPLTSNLSVHACVYLSSHVCTYLGSGVPSAGRSLCPSLALAFLQVQSHVFVAGALRVQVEHFYTYSLQVLATTRACLSTGVPNVGHSL